MHDRHGEGPRDLVGLVVPRLGAVSTSPRTDRPWVLLDADGSEVESVSEWLTDLLASDYAVSTLRSYAYDLLGWHRFLWAIDVSWRQVTRWEIRDWVRWLRIAPNEQRRRSSAAEMKDGRPAAGSVNLRTGKPYLHGGHAPASINHRLAVLSGFYDYAVESGMGPLVNPVPRVPIDRQRVFSRRAVPGSAHTGPRAAYRQRQSIRAPRQLTDELFNEFFAQLPSDRDRALVATAVSSGARASELLSMRRVDLHADELSIDVVPKGGRDRAPVRASPDAFMWMSLHLAERPVFSPLDPVWMTIRGTPRPLTYWAMRQVLERANCTLGSNITFHDLRHTYCYRLTSDPNMLITDIQELMRHRSLATTQVYIRARMDDLIAKLQEHYARPPTPPPAPAVGYDPAAMAVLFPGAFE